MLQPVRYCRGKILGTINSRTIRCNFNAASNILSRIQQGNELRDVLVKHKALISPKILIASFDDLGMGLGLKTNSKIFPNEVLASIPASLCISYIRNDDDNHFGIYAGLNKSDQIFIAKVATSFGDGINPILHFSRKIANFNDINDCQMLYLSLFPEADLQYLPIFWSEKKLTALSNLGVFKILKLRTELLASLAVINTWAAGSLQCD